MTLFIMRILAMAMAFSSASSMAEEHRTINYTFVDERNFYRNDPRCLTNVSDENLTNFLCGEKVNWEKIRHMWNHVEGRITNSHTWLIWTREGNGYGPIAEMDVLYVDVEGGEGWKFLHLNGWLTPPIIEQKSVWYEFAEPLFLLADKKDVIESNYPAPHFTRNFITIFADGKITHQAMLGDLWPYKEGSESRQRLTQYLSVFWWTLHSPQKAAVQIMPEK